jgi:hypothetical protein
MPIIAALDESSRLCTLYPRWTKVPAFAPSIPSHLTLFLAAIPDTLSESYFPVKSCDLKA